MQVWYRWRTSLLAPGVLAREFGSWSLAHVDRVDFPRPSPTRAVDTGFGAGLMWNVGIATYLEEKIESEGDDVLTAINASLELRRHGSRLHPRRRMMLRALAGL